MNIRSLSAFLIILIFFLSKTFAQTNPPFSYKVYGNFANFFESETDLLNFFEFNRGDVIAEVGAGNGQNIAGLSILIDSTTLYAQDINAVSLNQKSFDKLTKRSARYKKNFTNNFHLCIGTEKASNLPENTFDKILLSATFHEFSFMDEMITDLSTKLKTGGKLYILESDCSGKNHKNYSADEVTEIMKQHNFYLIKKDGKNINGATGLFRAVYAKNN